MNWVFSEWLLLSLRTDAAYHTNWVLWDAEKFREVLDVAAGKLSVRSATGLAALCLLVSLCSELPISYFTQYAKSPGIQCSVGISGLFPAFLSDFTHVPQFSKVKKSFIGSLWSPPCVSPTEARCRFLSKVELWTNIIE